MKNKIWLGVGVGAFILVLTGIGGGYWYYQQQQDDVTLGAASISGSDETTSSQVAGNEQATGPQTLGVKTEAPTAKNLGQISQTGGLTNSTLGGSTPTQPSNNSSSGSQTIDPATFSQYEKYKNENQALFGDLSQGNGATLANGQTAYVIYKGWLTNGQMFDQSRTGADGKLQAYSFKVGSGQVIRGWDQGLIGMKVGGTRLLVVPPSVGYGPTGQGPIPGNAVLVFAVQLVDVK